MDAVFQFWALMAIAAAIYSGLHAIASAIRYRVVDVRLPDQINVIHQGKS